MKKYIKNYHFIILLAIIAYALVQYFDYSDKKDTEEFIPIDYSSEDSFTKKKECAGYKDKIMEDILTPNLLYKDSDPELTEIFYSPKRNSCLYVFNFYKSPDCLKMDTETYFKVGCSDRNSLIIDFLTKETVYSSIAYNNCFNQVSTNIDADISVCKTVYKKAEELKN